MSNIVQYWKIKNSTYPLKIPMAKQVANIILLVLSLFHLIQSIYGEREIEGQLFLEMILLFTLSIIYLYICIFLKTRLYHYKGQNN